MARRFQRSITAAEVRAYRDEHGVGLHEAKARVAGDLLLAEIADLRNEGDVEDKLDFLLAIAEGLALRHLA